MRSRSLASTNDALLLNTVILLKAWAWVVSWPCRPYDYHSPPCNRSLLSDNI